jgi:lipid-A-disaccharide synthase
MKYFLVAGEPSGDLHGSSLIEELKKIDSEAEFNFFGGDLMRAAGEARPVRHIKELAYMGFWTVFKKLPTIIKNLRLCKRSIMKFQPDAVILIDYPSFNLRIAKFVRKHAHNIPVHYYISPSVWAWKSYRVKQIKRDVTQMLTIIPFEKEFYASHNFEVQYVGNPAIDFIDTQLDKTEETNYFKKKYFLNEKPIIALLPGSRKQEISSCLPKMIAAARKYPEYQIVISGVNSVHTAFYHEFMGGHNYPIIKHHPYQLLFHAELAIVNSGTATLETALIGTPQIVVYHVMLGRLAYLAKRIFIKTKNISLVNILAEEEIVKELYAHLFTTKNLAREIERILFDEKFRTQMIVSYKELRDKLGKPGTSKRAADIIYNYSKSS